MGADLFPLRPQLLGKRADRILGWSLREMCLEAPEEVLTRTEHAQPALFAVSYALWDLLSPRVGPPQAAAGHSLGEYTALAAAGVLSFEDALELVAARGRAMAEASGRAKAGMAALIGVDDDQAEEVAAARRRLGGKLYVANLNAPGQVVVAGGEEDLQWLGEAAASLGLRRVVPLNVAGGFHSPFMASAAAVLADALSGVDFGPAAFPVWSNAAAVPLEAKSDYRQALVSQLTAPVRFAEILRGMANLGINRFLHVGPGDVTAGLARRSVSEAVVLVLSEPAGIDGVVDSLGTIP
jgi:[acyl-carrier-protein] S-malonyltransferase